MSDNEINNYDFDPDLLVFNGINGATGDYGIQPMTEAEFARQLKFDIERDVESFPVGDGIDPTDLAQTGWGIIFADGDPNVEAIKEALSELLELRREQAFGPHPEKPNKETEKYFKTFEGPDGYRPGDSKRSFLGRHGVGTGPVYPEKGVPYYLLLVGSPEQIPFQFQFQLSVQYAVGRIHFDMLQEYANYARSVVAAEKGEVKLPRKANFFGVENANDRATQMSSKHLITPLNERLKLDFTDWQLESFTSGQATKDQLVQLLGGPQKPALLFTASHGMEFPLGDSRQFVHQGALLCQDWPGPKRHRGPIPEDFYFAGDALDSNANLLGMITFAFACYGAGCPTLDEFSKQSGKSREPIAPNSFLANLPKKMLSHPKGGALAFVGHVERAWGYSFMAPEVGSNTAMFESALSGLLYGDPIGYAVEDINLRFAEIATDLTSEIQDLEYFQEQAQKGNPEHLEKLLAEKSQFLVRLWTEHNDARDYVIIGDPAVRLPLAEEGEPPIERPAIEVADFSSKTLSGTNPSTAQTPATTQVAESASTFAPSDVETSELGPYGLGDVFREGQAKISEAMQQFAQNLSTFLSEAIENATSLEVATYTSENLTGVEYQGGKFVGPAELRALSRINVDGDTSLVVPVQEGEIDKELLAIHLEMVKQAQAGRNELIQTAVSAVASLASFWKPG